MANRILYHLFCEAEKSEIGMRHSAALVQGGKIKKIAHNTHRGHAEFNLLVQRRIKNKGL